MEELDGLYTPPIVEYKKCRLSVTDFSSQLWCETKMWYSLATGYREETLAMRQGTERHLQLEKEDHEVVELEVSTREDNLGIRLFNTLVSLQDILPRQGKVREVWVGICRFDSVVRGVIDQIDYVRHPSGALLIKDTKTRRTPDEPSLAQKKTSAIQLQVYMWLISELRRTYGHEDWTKFFQLYNVDPQRPFETEVLQKWSNLNDLILDYHRAFAQLPVLTDYALVEYECAGVMFKADQIPYRPSATMFALHDAFALWWGERRAPRPVKLDEKWKCYKCCFLGICGNTPLSEEEKATCIRQKQELDVLAQDLEELGD
ncbi:defects in morphology protein 1 [Gregarina niphandrodes]|uniref:Defects in morphology protein 1 n=1 Tax=Gregarina niphandrodes TaxID=110365 RepID=A0A023B343_GRENI|nr:defects in morphology protein 1 [Gregarina niphandrodes]EZG55343.1 defects in morphology protein 1 [Gregarina niphandrodes]|eukprot:XP_011131638.1 defects in morphology protein 1 [Gregarina niphandrodes]